MYQRPGYPRLFIATMALLAPTVVYACIWQNGPAPYWPSLQIPVCFNPPSATERRSSLTEFRRAQGIIQRAYEGMSAASSVRFVGFGFCEEENPRTPKIRIDLAETGSTGEAAGIGPSFSTTETNLTIPYIMAGKISSQPINETNLSFLTVHETMHLLGFQHDKTREDAKYFSTLRNTVVIGAFDPQSAMSMELDDNTLISRNQPMSRSSPYLSAGDRHCLNLLAERQITTRGVTDTQQSTPRAQ